MKVTRGQTVLLTGATGGLGAVIAQRFAREGVNLALAAFPGVDLEALRATVERAGAKAGAWVADLRDAGERQRLLAGVRQSLGDVDILINNAGVEFTSAYHHLTAENLQDILRINLEAPMELTRLLLPGMLARRRGHIVNISSLAGKSGPAFQEPYAATKAALVAFTASLRASYRNSGVSASVVVPGFVEAGIYASLKARSGCSAPLLLGTSKPERVADAVLAVIESDCPEKLINPVPVRPMLALSALWPRLGEWITEQTGANDFFRRVVGKLQPAPAEATKKHS